MTEPQWSDFERARPRSRVPEDWVNTVRGREVLDEVRRAAAGAPVKRGLPPRRWVLGIAVAAAVAGGGGAAYALTDHARQPVSTASVGCLKTASLQADDAVVSTNGSTSRAAVMACSEQWSALWPSTPKPSNFAICVFPRSKGQSGGGLLVIPASPGADNDSACRAIGADVIEQ